jgi:hypothetical protein
MEDGRLGYTRGRDDRWRFLLVRLADVGVDTSEKLPVLEHEDTSIGKPRLRV